MKTINILTVLMISATISFFGCTTDDIENELSKGEINANLIREVLSTNTIKYVEIYEYNFSTGGWNLAADNQNYNSDMDLCHVKGSYLYLDGGGSKSYPTSNVPTHQMSGLYYFNLEYLVSFDLDSNNTKLYLYFKY